MPLPEPPKVVLDIVADRSDEPHGFLTRRSYELTVVADGKRSAPLRYDMIERRALDASVFAAHYIDVDGRPRVYLRTAIRPPILLRKDAPKAFGTLWELPAGLIEPGESPAEAAARELEEELGFTATVADLEPLGPPALPAPSFIAEVLHYFHLRVDPSARREPPGDGSPLEEGARIEAFVLDDALAACRRGEIPDTKTELALRRLAEVLSHGRT